MCAFFVVFVFLLQLVILFLKFGDPTPRKLLKAPGKSEGFFWNAPLRAVWVIHAKPNLTVHLIAILSSAEEDDKFKDG